jgi:hypothetical protein
MRWDGVKVVTQPAWRQSLNGDGAPMNSGAGFGSHSCTESRRV